MPQKTDLPKDKREFSDRITNLVGRDGLIPRIIDAMTGKGVAGGGGLGKLFKSLDSILSDKVFKGPKNRKAYASKVKILGDVFSIVGTFAAAMKEAQRQSLKELTAFQAWLQSKGEQNANQLAKQLLTGQQAALPTYIAIKWQTVVYASKIKIAGVQVGPNRVLPNRHAAFVFIWKGAGGSRKSTVPSNIDNAKIAQISDDGGGVLGNGNGNGNNAGNTDRKKIQLTSLHCIETEDFFGADESYLVVWVDGRKLQTFRRDLNDGHTLPLNLSIEFSDAVTLELWDLDEPDVGDSHDFLGQVTISKNELSGVKFFTRDGANYRVTWKKGS